MSKEVKKISISEFFKYHDLKVVDEIIKNDIDFEIFDYEGKRVVKFLSKISDSDVKIIGDAFKAKKIISKMKTQYNCLEKFLSCPNYLSNTFTSVKNFNDMLNIFVEFGRYIDILISSFGIDGYDVESIDCEIDSILEYALYWRSFPKHVER